MFKKMFMNAFNVIQKTYTNIALGSFGSNLLYYFLFYFVILAMYQQFLFFFLIKVYVKVQNCKIEMCNK